MALAASTRIVGLGLAIVPSASVGTPPLTRFSPTASSDYCSGPSCWRFGGGKTFC
jgi:hypothetical protein